MVNNLAFWLPKPLFFHGFWGGGLTVVIPLYLPFLGQISAFTRKKTNLPDQKADIFFTYRWKIQVLGCPVGS